MTAFPSLGDYNGNFVHPRLAVGGCPHPEHVPTFVAAGIRGIIDGRSCMLKEHIAYVAELPDSIHWEMLGTWDGIYPNETWTERDPDRPSAATTVCPVYAAFMVERMARVVRDHSPVLIHCGGGIGRSGNLAAVAFAALEDTTVDEALDRMRTRRPVLAGWSPARWTGSDPARLVDLAQGILRGGGTGEGKR
jgi:protein-tyrosine phosphatase